MLSALDQLALSTVGLAPVPGAVAALPFLANLPDPRDRRGRRYPLPALLAAAAASVLAGARSLTAVTEWITDAPGWALRALGFAPDPLSGAVTAPHPYTLRRLLSLLDGDALDTAIGAFLTTWAHTRAGQDRPAMTALGEAAEALSEDSVGTESPSYLYWMDAGELQVMEARVYTELRCPLRAVPLLTYVLGRYDANHARELALYLSWLAVAYADANEPETAAGTAGRMLALGQSGSERTAERTRIVLDRLRAYRATCPRSPNFWRPERPRSWPSAGRSQPPADSGPERVGVPRRSGTEPVRVQRRVSAVGTVMVCRQVVSLGRPYAGQTVTVYVSDTTITVDLDGQVRVIRRTTDVPVRNVKANRPRKVSDVV